ncbi:hypothetical protein NMY22_g9611 [Coprinellus aureogranulatus]|nr:hypothetical protein NMY22_g9611 [Coprinellus aureogranulatus]
MPDTTSTLHLVNLKSNLISLEAAAALTPIYTGEHGYASNLPQLFDFDPFHDPSSSLILLLTWDAFRCFFDFPSCVLRRLGDVHKRARDTKRKEGSGNSKGILGPDKDQSVAFALLSHLCFSFPCHCRKPMSLACPGWLLGGVEAQTKIRISGIDGEPVCSLRDRLNEGSCGATASRREILSLRNVALGRRADDFVPTPSPCTCNTPFFNIWSACELFERRSNVLPLLKEWEANCTSANVAFTKSFGNNFIGDIEVPKWSRKDAAADNGLFDVAGIVLACAPNSWSIIQIVAPLASAVATLLIITLIYVSCVRWKPNFSTFFTCPRLHFLRPSRVQREEPKNDWVIDTGKERLDDIATPFPTTTVFQPRRSESFDEERAIPQPTVVFQPNRPAHHVVPLPLSNAPVLVEEEDEEMGVGELPLTSRWSDSEHQTPVRTKPRVTFNKPRVTFFPNVLKAIPNPFKAKPVRVEHVAPRPGFRVYDEDVGTESAYSSLNNSKKETDDDAKSVGSSLMRELNEDEVERVTLISSDQRRENDVFLISKTPGVDFSLSSKSGSVAGPRSVVTTSEGTNSTTVGVNFESPTASSLTHSWSASGNSQIPPVPQLPPPRLPPPPKAPPPRVKQTISFDRFPLANIQDEPPPKQQSSGSGSASNPTRTIPITVNQAAGQTARINLLHPPLRPIYELEKYPSTTSLHQRSFSQTTPDVQALQPTIHRRGASDPDDPLSYYLNPQDSQTSIPKLESTMQLRPGSKERLHSRKSDPSMLFPPSVRSAGITLTPTVAAIVTLNAVLACYLDRKATNEKRTRASMQQGSIAYRHILTTVTIFWKNRRYKEPDTPNDRDGRETTHTRHRKVVRAFLGSSRFVSLLWSRSSCRQVASSGDMKSSKLGKHNIINHSQGLEPFESPIGCRSSHASSPLSLCPTAIQYQGAFRESCPHDEGVFPYQPYPSIRFRERTTHPFQLSGFYSDAASHRWNGARSSLGRLTGANIGIPLIQSLSVEHEAFSFSISSAGQAIYAMLSSSKTLRATDRGVDRHSRDTTEATVVNTRDLANDERDRVYYTTFYDQFSNVIMISTFTGGVQAAILSFMNDLLGGEGLGRQLFYPDPRNAGRLGVYTSYSLGLMLGLLAIALNLAVAATAAVNAALACHFSLHSPQKKISMEARIVFCMLVQFIASGIAGISLILLCIEFDLAFTIVAAVLFFSGIIVSAYHLVSLFGSKWFTELKGQPLNSISLVISTIAFAFDVLSPSYASWFTITIYGFTAVYHMLAVLQYYIKKNNPRPPSQVGEPQGNTGGPGKLATIAVFVISGLWGGCVALTLALRYTRPEGKVDIQGEVVKDVVAALATLEALVCFAIGVFNLGVIRGLWGTKQGTTDAMAPNETRRLEGATPSG